MPPAGAEDLRRAADQLAARLPYALAPLARLAYNYRWSWLQGGPGLFKAVDPHRWELCGHNPVRLLQETSTAALERAATDYSWEAHARRILEALGGSGARR